MLRAIEVSYRHFVTPANHETEPPTGEADIEVVRSDAVTSQEDLSFGAFSTNVFGRLDG